jgi:hypothetical protein
MRAARKLFTTVAEGSILFSVMSWVLVFALAVQKRAVFDGPASLSVAIVLGTLIIFLPHGLAAGWTFRKLRVLLSRDEARRATIAFAVSAPVTLAIGYPLSLLVGGYAEVPLGSRFILPSIGVFIITLMALIPNGVVMWALHPSGGVSQAPESDQQ